jgi:hypothetical protein
MPRGIEPTSPTSSINPVDQSSKRGVSAAVSADIVFGPGSNSRGVTVTTSEPGGTLPR